MRYNIKSNDKVGFQVDCSYKEEGSSWIPIRWTVNNLDNNGSIMSSSSDEVKEYKINPAIRTSDFDLAFPVGTLVSDQRPQPGIGRTGTLDYIVKVDGTKRIVTWNESDATYEELLATGSGQATAGRAANKPKKSPYTSNLILSLNILVIVVLICWIAIRKKFRKKT